MANIPSLPGEIWMVVFENLHGDRKQDLINSQLTCKKFRQFAQEVLCRHICLDAQFSSDSRLSRLVQSRPDPGSIRSFRLKGFPTPTPCVTPAAIDPVCGLLNSLTRLRTFSLNLDRTDRGNAGLFPSFWIARMLHSLPISVINLELDTNACDDTPEEGVHLCPLIRNLLSQLEVLRLRISQLCMDVFCLESGRGQTTLALECFRLRVAVIQLSLNVHSFNRARLMEDRRPPIRLMDCSNPKDRNGIHAAPLAENLRVLYEAGLYPRLQAFLILESQWISWREFHAYSFFRVHNIIDNNTTTIPHNLVYWDESNESIPKGLMLVHDEEGNELIGFDEDTPDWLEGPCAWEELSDGTRLPPRIATRSTYEPRWSDLLSRKASEAQLGLRGMTTDLWELEQLVACKNLKATVREGLKDYYPPEMELPPGWEFIEVEEGGGWAVEQVQT